MTERVQLRVAKLDCEKDAAAIDRAFRDMRGIEELNVYPKSAKVALTFDREQTSLDIIKKKLISLGFPPAEGREAVAQSKPWRNPKVVTSVLSGVLLAIGWFAGRAGAGELVVKAIYVVSAVTGGYYFAREAIEEVVFEREIGIEMLMSAGAVVAIIMGETMEGAMLAFLYSISEAAEGYTEEKTRGAIRALMDLTPKKATRLREGREVEVPVEDLEVGDVFLVKSGQSMATDGVVVRGASAVNQAPITGESVPVEKNAGDTVFAGTINGEGSLDVRATKTYADNTIARIIEMVEEAQEKKGQSERFIQRFGKRYSPSILALGILIALVVPLLTGGDWRMWITRATVFVVAAAPCALVISIPITLVAALGTGARNGVLIKGGIYVEELAKIRVVALDKTGTITSGEPQVSELRVVGSVGERDFLARVAAVERRSQHPLAAAIVSHAQANRVDARDVEAFQSLTGAGATGRVDGRTIYVGSPALLTTTFGRSLDSLHAEVERLQSQGNTVILAGDDHEIWGLIAVRDTVRPTARAAIGALHALGARVVMLTGDNVRAAEAIAREVGIDAVFADLKPEDKAAKVRELSTTVGHVAMVGDGVNDAPALAEATVGVAMGAAGTDVALETADVALMADDLNKLVYAMELAKRNQSVVKQNLALSAIVISALVIGAIAGYLTLPIAVVAHEFSEFVVIASGLRMLRS